MAIDGSKEKTSLRPSIDTSILPYRPQIFTYDQIHYTSGGAPVQKQGFAPHGGENSADSRLPVIFLRVAPHRGRTQPQTYERRTDHRRACCFLLSESELPADSLHRLQVGIPLCILHILYPVSLCIFVYIVPNIFIDISYPI